MRSKLRILYGESQLPAFVRQRQAKRLQLPPDTTEPRWFALYLIEQCGEPTESAAQQLQSLLQAQTQRPVLGSNCVVILPRRGTLSAWSSKATEIARGCGLTFIERIELGSLVSLPPGHVLDAKHQAELYDPLTQELHQDLAVLDNWLQPQAQRRLQRFAGELSGALQQANQQLSLGLSQQELEYLQHGYTRLEQQPSDAELMMFAQANSEHCRHKIFNANWTLGGQQQALSLFDMIRHTHQQSPQGVLSAYSDNAAVISGYPAQCLQVDTTGRYQLGSSPAHIQIKVETHNHPTAISPYPGAATGSGGEIRDEAATGRGAHSRAGLTGFSVSELQIPDFQQPWECAVETPPRMASALQIMLEGPIGAAAFNNEFGRPGLAGYFRTLTIKASQPNCYWGYHKPIMLAGGMGRIQPQLIAKQRFPAGTRVVVLGGPAMLIGLGGGAASSAHSGARDSGYDYASVQRGNPEMQRRCQEVINYCNALGDDSPILAMHDVGAGGLSNAIPELLHDAGCGGELELRAIPSADPALSPMEIWCNEAQERYVLAVDAARLPELLTVCQRERCPVADVGVATAEQRLRLHDAQSGDYAVDMPMGLLLGNLPRMQRQAPRYQSRTAHDSGATAELAWSGDSLLQQLTRVLRLPAVASKKFLVTIGDRYVGGLTCRDQMVGPWQVPVADYAAVLDDFSHATGAVMSIGERTPVAIDAAPAAGRLAVVEALTNLAGAAIGDLGQIKLSANWMAACGEPGQDAALFATVEAVGMQLCPALGIAIPVGKDSLSMRSQWQDSHGQTSEVQAPVSLVVSAFAPLQDARLSVTPQLQADSDSHLVLLSLSPGQQRLGQSALAQVYQQIGLPTADVDDAQIVKRVFALLQQAVQEQRLLACHDRSDGGLLTTVLEMAFAGRCGVQLDIPADSDASAWLFNEEPGLVLQLQTPQLAWLQQACAQQQLQQVLQVIGQPNSGSELVLQQAGQVLLQTPLWQLEKIWAETSFRLQQLRDNPSCAEQEYAAIDAWQSPPLQFQVPTSPQPSPQRPAARYKPRVAILREQGVNSHTEMAAAFMYAGCEAIDIHMTDLQAEPGLLNDMQGLVACGGFSYGDVLGAGRGWAASILYNPLLRQQFADFFADPQRFALGVCNGCQMLAALREIIPGSQHWPDFVANLSGQFECRLSQVEVPVNPSVFLGPLAGASLPIVTAHGEGRPQFANDIDRQQASVCLQYVEQPGQPTERYPANPNGAQQGICGLTTSDGRITIVMPHPERTLQGLNFSWAPAAWRDGASPWLEMFVNAHDWCQQRR